MTPIERAEDQRHHLQRSELEALRAENATLKEYMGERREQVKGFIFERDQLRVDVEILTKERDEALQDRDFVQCGLNSCVDDCNTLRARIQKLEGALKDVGCLDMCDCCPGGCHHGGDCCVCPALESGTGPIDPIGPIEQPIAPAPKTFTTVEIEELLNAAEMRANDTTPGMHVGEEFLMNFRIEIRRALGLGEP